jgi:hypothetical protein
MKPGRKLIVLVLLCLSLGGAASAQKRNDDELLRTRETVWRAWFAGDIKTLKELVPQETVVMSGGEEKWKTQADILQGSSEFHAKGGEADSARIPTYSGAALRRRGDRVE